MSEVWYEGERFDLRSFCGACGRFRMTMPFGDANPFWDRKPCKGCGGSGPGVCVVARRRWFSRRWIGRDGLPVAVSVSERSDDA